jgi:hypothetical protein
MTFTIEQVREYVEGFLGADNDMQALDLNQIKAMLSNAKACVDDPSDGIVDYVGRQGIPLYKVLGMSEDSYEKSLLKTLENEMNMTLDDVYEFVDQSLNKK